MTLSDIEKLARLKQQEDQAAYANAARIAPDSAMAKRYYEIQARRKVRGREETRRVDGGQDSGPSIGG